MARLTREQVLNAKDIQQQEIEVKEWGGTVLVQSLSALQRRQIIKSCTDKDGILDPVKFQTAVIVAACVDPKFERADIDALSEKKAGIIAKLAESIAEVSGFSVTPEEAEKNS
jgi:hypothetical protein